jgi:hypothetical protein
MLKFLMQLLGGNKGESSAVGILAKDIREAIKGKELDPEKLIELQTKINEAEAMHRSIFVAGWRPFIGWICGIAMAYNFILRDLIIFAMGKDFVPPALQMDHLMTVLMGILGLGAFRTYEKIKNVSK